MDKEQIIAILDKEIEFAKGRGTPQIVMGLQQAKRVVLEEFKRNHLRYMKLGGFDNGEN